MATPGVAIRLHRPGYGPTCVDGPLPAPVDWLCPGASVGAGPGLGAGGASTSRQGVTAPVTTSVPSVVSPPSSLLAMTSVWPGWTWPRGIVNVTAPPALRPMPIVRGPGAGRPRGSAQVLPAGV